VDLKLSGKTALVFGGSRGLGKAIAEELAAEGVRVVIVARDPGRVARVAAELGVQGFSGDVSKPGAGRKLVEQCAELLGQGPDILVTNTGGPAPGAFAATTAVTWQAGFDNLWMSFVDSVQAVLPSMRQNRWGRILAVTSVAAREPQPGLVISNSLRAGLLGLVNTISREVARDGVTINALLPGWLGKTNEITRMFLAAGRVPDLINMAGGLPEPETYPVAELAAIAERAISQHPHESLNYPPIEGLPDLRDRIAARFSNADLKLRRENVLITSGGMQALDLIGKVLLDDGGLIAAQAPTYLGAVDAWRPRYPSYRLFSTETNDFDPLAALSGAQFAYTVPNFSNPTGRLVGLARRQELVGAAHRIGTWLIEDDPYGTLYYDGTPLPRMITLSGAQQSGTVYDGPVVYMGTLSKEIAPGLRIGWVIASPDMIGALTIAKQGSDMCTSGLSQRVAVEALDAGLLERTLPVILDIYRQRRDALCAAMDEHLAEWFDWEKPVGGMFVWATAKNPALDTDKLLQAAMKAGVCISPSSVFDPHGEDRRSVRINFTLNGPERLAEGTRRLTVALKTMGID
jgi:2-aminoadipate transaminase